MTQPNQYRPISITLVLSRIIEKYIVREHIHPCLTNSLIKSSFDNQFSIVFVGSSPDTRWKYYKNTANSRTKKENIKIYENKMFFAFRPTGSPFSAIIYLTSVITSLLTYNKFVRLIALDFSKAFDIQ